MTTDEPSSDRPDRPVGASRRLALVLAFVSVALGIWLFLDATGTAVLPPLAKFWPIFVAVGAVASLVDHLFVSRRPRSLGHAVFGFGLAGLLFAVTFGALRWENVLDVLPSVPTLIGLALLSTWLVDTKKNRSVMVTGSIFLALGLLGFAARFEQLQRLLPRAQVVWAALFLFAGTVAIWRILAKKS